MIIFAILLLAVGKPFYPSGIQGAQVATSCQAATDNTAISLCSSYALGVFDAMAEQNLICSDRETTIAQIVAVGKKELADHPEDWSKPPSWVLGRAFKRAFPCRN